MSPQQPAVQFVPVPQAPEVRQYHGNDVPARVQVALTFLDSLTFKTMTRGMVNDVGMQEIEGQKLTVEEAHAQNDALSMLRSYFAGNLGPTAWEQYQMNQAVVMTRGTLRTVECPNCKGKKPKVADCALCSGQGFVTVS